MPKGLKVFKKSRIPWNKGLVGCYSVKTLKKMSDSRKNKQPWNKGKSKTDYPQLRNSGRSKGCITWNKGKTGICSEETLLKMSKSQQGEKHWNWQGGPLLYPAEWTTKLKRTIRKRDNYSCQLCESYGYTVHHIDYNKHNSDTDNLINLCVNCHMKTNYNREYWTNYFQRKCLSSL